MKSWAEVDWHLCQSCNPCPARPTCTTRAIVKLAGDEPAFIEQERCRGCAKCLLACPHSAIRLSNAPRPNNEA